jgi:hypothetical protein
LTERASGIERLRIVDVTAVVRAHEVAIERVLLGHTIAVVCYDCH